MQEVLASTKAENLHLYIVWLPMLRSDDRDSAFERTKEFSDPRVSYYWDDSRITGAAWRDLLNLPTTAWDIYFLYSSKTNWTEVPGKPVFWMHQLRGIDAGPFLDKDEFKLKVLRMLN